MNTVAQPPHSDGKQPAGEAHSSRRTPLAAPNPAWREVLDAYEADVKTLPLGHEMPTRGCSTYNWKMSVLREIRQRFETSAPFPTPQASSSQATAGTSALSAHDLGALPLSIHEDPCLSAQLAMGIRW